MGKNNLHEFRIRRVPRPRVAEAMASYGKIAGPSAAVAMLRAITAGADRETFVTISLGANGRPVGYEITAIGGLTGVEVHPREVFRTAILAGAAMIVVGHNHPSGDHTPSPDDLALTRRLRAVSEVVGVPLVDHVVIGADADGYSSMSEMGIFG